MPTKRKNRKNPRIQQPSTDTRAGEALTVGWMLSVMTTVACEVGVVTARVVHAVGPEFERVVVLGELLLFAAVVSGLVSLLLAAMVFRVRQVAPPNGVTAFALIVAVAPLVALFLRLGADKF
jgi:hypothetical protein